MNIVKWMSLLVILLLTFLYVFIQPWLSNIYA